MQLDAKRNFFTFFSGYLHLPLTAPRLHIDIDDFYGPRGAEEDPDGPPRPPAPAAEPDELAVGRSPLPPELLPDPWELLDLSAAVRPIAPFAARLPTLPIKPLPPDPVTYSHGGGGGDSPLSPKQTVVFRQSQITVDYKDGGNPLDLRVDQVNTLRDNDIVTTLHHNDLDDSDVVTDADAESVAWPDHDIMPIAELAQMAKPHVPDAYAGATATPESVVAALRALGDSRTSRPRCTKASRSTAPRLAPMHPCRPGARRPGAGASGRQRCQHGGRRDRCQQDRKLRCRHRRAGRHRYDDRAR